MYDSSGRVARSHCFSDWIFRIFGFPSSWISENMEHHLESECLERSPGSRGSLDTCNVHLETLAPCHDSSRGSPGFPGFPGSGNVHLVTLQRFLPISSESGSTFCEIWCYLISGSCYLVVNGFRSFTSRSHFSLLVTNQVTIFRRRIATG